MEYFTTVQVLVCYYLLVENRPHCLFSVSGLVEIQMVLSRNGDD